jgi:hypothetical protein
MTSTPQWPQGQSNEPTAPYDYQEQGNTTEAATETVSTQPVDPYAAPVDPYTAPVDPYAQPADPYAAPVDPYATPAPDAYAVSDTSTTSSTKDVAKDEAANVKDTAVDAGKNVASTAKDEAANVATEAKDQAKGLLTSVTSQVSEQAGTQKQKIAETVHSFAKELGGMASGEGSSGPITDLAQQASEKVGEIGHFLENKEPREILDEVSAFARRRPGLFLVLCGAAGVLAGRVTRGAVAANTSVDSPDTSAGRRSLQSAPAAEYTYATPVAPETVAPVYGTGYQSDRI